MWFLLYTLIVVATKHNLSHLQAQVATTFLHSLASSAYTNVPTPCFPSIQGTDQGTLSSSVYVAWPINRSHSSLSFCSLILIGSIFAGSWVLCGLSLVSLKKILNPFFCPSGLWKKEIVALIISTLAFELKMMGSLLKMLRTCQLFPFL